MIRNSGLKDGRKGRMGRKCTVAYLAGIAFCGDRDYSMQESGCLLNYE